MVKIINRIWCLLWLPVFWIGLIISALAMFACTLSLRTAIDFIKGAR